MLTLATLEKDSKGNPVICVRYLKAGAAQDAIADWEMSLEEVRRYANRHWASPVDAEGDDLGSYDEVPIEKC